MTRDTLSPLHRSEVSKKGVFDKETQSRGSSRAMRPEKLEGGRVVGLKGSDLGGGRVSFLHGENVGGIQRFDQKGVLILGSLLQSSEETLSIPRSHRERER